MLDGYNREITYLRISVTDRCNLRCYYCIGGHESDFIRKDKILSLEEIIEFSKSAIKFGITKIRLTGGEPLVRKNILYLVKSLASLKGITDLAMTTNGILLGDLARDLKNAGLKRLNVSLDSVDPERFSRITNGGNLNTVLNSLQKAKDIGFYPIKINCVIENSTNEKDAIAVSKYCKKNGFEVRFIKRMNTENGSFWPVIGGDSGNCKTCNRLRLSSDGMLFPCLFSNFSYSVKELGYEEAIVMAIKGKPECGNKSSNKFHKIGG